MRRGKRAANALVLILESRLEHLLMVFGALGLLLLLLFGRRRALRWDVGVALGEDVGGHGCGAMTIVSVRSCL